MIRISRKIETPYSQDLLFQIAQDVENYPKFLPNCMATRIKEKQPDYWIVDNIFRWGPVKQKFKTIAKIAAPQSISVQAHPSEPMKFYVKWDFEQQKANGCVVHFQMGFKSRMPLLEKVVRKFMKKSASKIEDAFLERAQITYQIDE